MGAEIFHNRRGEAGNIVGFGLERGRLAVLAQRVAGDRADAARDASLRPLKAQFKEVVHGGTGCEGDQIRAFRG